MSILSLADRFEQHLARLGVRDAVDDSETDVCERDAQPEAAPATVRSCNSCNSKTVAAWPVRPETSRSHGRHSSRRQPGYARTASPQNRAAWLARIESQLAALPGPLANSNALTILVVDSPDDARPLAPVKLAVEAELMIQADAAILEAYARRLRSLASDLVSIAEAADAIVHGRPTNPATSSGEPGTVGRQPR